MADNTNRITKIGSHLIIIDDGAYVTKAGAYAEILGEGLRVTSSGAVAEILETGALVTTYKASKTGNRAAHALLPEQVTGYAFDPKWSWWSVIKSQESQNILRNPSFEIALGADPAWESTAWASAAIDSGESPGATAGKYTYKMVCNPLTLSILTYIHGAGPAGVDTGIGSWTFAIDVYSAQDQFDVLFRIYERLTNIVLAQNTFTLKRGWQRIHLSWTNVATRTILMTLRVEATNTLTNTLYVDRAQLENSRYPTTYFDGDMIGWDDPYTTYSYFWQGARHDSDAVRRAETNSGGSIESLSDNVGFLTTAIIGLGMNPFNTKTISLDSGKEILVDSQAQPRDFTVTGRIYGCDYSRLSDRRNELIKLVQPQNHARREPIILRFQPTTTDGVPYGIPLDIKCAYTQGLEGNLASLYQENIPLQFRASEPAVYEAITAHANVVGRETLEDNQVIYRDKDYLYQNLGSGNTTGTVNKCKWMADTIVCGGAFALLCGDLVDNIAYWDGTNWQNPEPANVPNGSVADLDTSFTPGGLSPGQIVACGAFTAMTDATVVRRVMYWRNPGGATWAEVCNGTNGDTNVVMIDKRDPDKAYVGGNFTADGPGLDADVHYVCHASDITNPAGWSPMGGGTNGRVWDIKTKGDGRIFVAGAFDTVYNASGLASPVVAPSVALWDENLGTAGEWSEVFLAGGAANAGLNNVVHGIEFGDDGMLYAVGIFTQNDGASYDLRGFARWNGHAWEEVLPITDWIQSGSTAHYNFDLDKDKNGILWVTCWNVQAPPNQLTVPGIGSVHMFGWKDGILYPPPYKHPSGALNSDGLGSVSFNDHNEMLLSFIDSHAAGDLYAPEKIEIEYEGTFETQPTLVAEGEFEPGFIEFPQMGVAGIYFGYRGDTLITADEVMFVRPEQAQHRVYTNVRSLLNSMNLPATSFAKAKLLPNQTNVLSVFMNELSSSDMYLMWHNKFASIDPGAIT